MGRKLEGKVAVVTGGTSGISYRGSASTPSVVRVPSTVHTLRETLASTQE